MFQFNRNEQIVLLMLSAALIVGIIVSYIDRNNSDAVPDFDVIKNAVPVPPLEEEKPNDSLDDQSPIDLNTATAKDFERLPGIGPQIAQRIVDYRTQNGPFTNVEDLTKVRGIGTKTFERLHPLITVTTP